ncbi:hypothetical protein C0V97_09395 [Asaia sp. W19]|uniref:hypothetical protein n=1 Tax=unclassified Asaia TaxID=2685023 RepID=UPI000F8E31C4|nr:hypothetical protein [Asaia sp. W19]RUT25804.1 hypothetical protein C0V97_09395 [Asaia sp. W19]
MTLTRYTNTRVGSRFDAKIARMRAGSDTTSDFILADAKDADMAGGLSALGTNRATGLPCTLSEFDAAITEIVKQDVVDILLASVSTLGRLDKTGIFANSPIRRAVRLNDTSDLWRIRGADYGRQPSIPFRTARLDLLPEPFGLYSMTFSGDAREDAESLSRYRDFRAEAQAAGVAHFLEVFNPVHPLLDQDDHGAFLNDMVSRTLAGMHESERPVFLKLAFNGARVLEAFCRYDRTLIVGIMGGGSGTTRDCLELLHQAQQSGARAALFGRKILDAEHPPSMVAMMRAVVERRLTPVEGVKIYHEEILARGLSPLRPIEADLQVTEPTLQLA